MGSSRHPERAELVARHLERAERVEGSALGWTLVPQGISHGVRGGARSSRSPYSRIPRDGRATSTDRCARILGRGARGGTRRTALGVEERARVHRSCLSTTPKSRSWGRQRRLRHATASRGPLRGSAPPRETRQLPRAWMPYRSNRRKSPTPCPRSTLRQLRVDQFSRGTPPHPRTRCHPERAQRVEGSVPRAGLRELRGPRRV
jgi:hypothetical protein